MYSLLSPTQHFNSHSEATTTTTTTATTTTTPRAVRAVLSTIDFTRLNGSKRKTNLTNWWYHTSKKDKEYLPRVEKRNPSITSFLKGNGWDRMTTNERISLEMNHRCLSLNAIEWFHWNDQLKLDSHDVCVALNFIKRIINFDFTKILIGSMIVLMTAVLFSESRSGDS